MSNYIYTNGGLVDADTLMHAKYIKKEPDGKGGWRYYYDTKALGKKVNKIKKKIVAKAKDIAGYDERERLQAAKSKSAALNTAYESAKAHKAKVDKANAERRQDVYDLSTKRSKQIAKRESAKTKLGSAYHDKRADRSSNKIVSKSTKIAKTEKEAEDRYYKSSRAKAENDWDIKYKQRDYDRTLLGQIDKAKQTGKAIKEEWNKSDAKREVDATKSAINVEKEKLKADWNSSDAKREIDAVKNAKAIKDAKTPSEKRKAEAKAAWNQSELKRKVDTVKGASDVKKAEARAAYDQSDLKQKVDALKREKKKKKKKAKK